MQPGTLVALCLTFCLAAPARAQEPAPAPAPELPAAELPALGGLPSLAELEAAGAVIGEIRIDPQNIFDLSDPRENNFIYRIANAIHVVSRPEVVRETLL